MKNNRLPIFTSRTSENKGLKREGGLFLLTKILLSIINHKVLSLLKSSDK